MIPKIIHFCWLSGDKYPALISHCMKSWHKLLPDYQFMLWDTNRFPLDQSVWVKEAFDSKKYAFAADYIRLYAVYNYGGIYLDCDVEVFKSFDDLLELPYFIGGEAYDSRWEIAAFGAEKACRWVRHCLDYYKDRHFVMEDGCLDMKPMPDVLKEVISKNYKIKSIGQIDEFERNDELFNIFPNDWFCAHINTQPDRSNNLQYIVSDNTYCVHHFANSWLKINRTRKYLRGILMKMGLLKY